MADLADRLTLGRFRAVDLAIETKPDFTPVSDADRAVEETIRRHLAQNRPADEVFGEELGLRAGVGAADGGARRRWLVDPIDGTKNYVRGIPVFATLLALQQGEATMVAVVSAPALNRRWWAVRGEGAFADGVRLSVSTVRALHDALLSYDEPVAFDQLGLARPFLDLAARCWRVRAFSDFWAHMLVAEGAVDVAVHAEPGVKPWDLAPVKLIVEEAGGRFTDLAGAARYDGDSAVSSNGLLHDEVLAALRLTPAGPS
ncbi:MAG: histidinol phosphatase [Actinomycetota bacterium]|nr:histidinol phosphatase [Actinomycetota bacterium]